MSFPTTRVHDILRRMEDNTSQPETMKTCFGILAIMSREEPNKLVIARDGMEIVLNVMSTHVDKTDVQESGCDLLWSLAFNNMAIKEIIAKFGGASVLVRALKRHHRSADFLKSACGALSNMCQSKLNQEGVASQGGLQPLVGAIHAHQSNGKLLLFIFDAIASLIVSNEENARAVSSLGLIPLVVASLSRHKSAMDVVKSGCHTLAILSDVKGQASKVAFAGGVPVILNLLEVHPSYADLHRVAAVVLLRMLQESSHVGREITCHEGVRILLKSLEKGGAQQDTVAAVTHILFTVTNPATAVGQTIESQLWLNAGAGSSGGTSVGSGGDADSGPVVLDGSSNKGTRGRLASSLTNSSTESFSTIASTNGVIRVTDSTSQFAAATSSSASGSSSSSSSSSSQTTALTGLVQTLGQYCERRDVVRASCRLLNNLGGFPGITNALEKLDALDRVLECVGIHTETRDVIESAANLMKSIHRRVLPLPGMNTAVPIKVNYIIGLLIVFRNKLADEDAVSACADLLAKFVETNNQPTLSSSQSGASTLLTSQQQQWLNYGSAVGRSKSQIQDMVAVGRSAVLPSSTTGMAGGLNSAAASSKQATNGLVSIIASFLDYRSSSGRCWEYEALVLCHKSFERMSSSDPDGGASADSSDAPSSAGGSALSKAIQQAKQQQQQLGQSLPLSGKAGKISPKALNSLLSLVEALLQSQRLSTTVEPTMLQMVHTSLQKLLEFLEGGGKNSELVQRIQRILPTLLPTHPSHHGGGTSGKTTHPPAALEKAGGGDSFSSSASTRAGASDDAAAGEGSSSQSGSSQRRGSGKGGAQGGAQSNSPSMSDQNTNDRDNYSSKSARKESLSRTNSSSSRRRLLNSSEDSHRDGGLNGPYATPPRVYKYEESSAASGKKGDRDVRYRKLLPLHPVKYMQECGKTLRGGYPPRLLENWPTFLERLLPISQDRANIFCADVPDRMSLCYESTSAAGKGIMSRCATPVPYNVPIEGAGEPFEHSLTFDSEFESGNLLRAVQRGDSEYDLFLRSDLHTVGHTQWFYFAVSNTHAPALVRLAEQGVQVPSVRVRFNIVNFTKPDSLFNLGMRPVVYSCNDAVTRGIGWLRAGHDIAYYSNSYQRNNTAGEGNAAYFTLSFTIEFHHAKDTVLLAYSYPYTVSDYRSHIAEILDKPHASDIIRSSRLCQTLGGEDCDLVVITNFKDTNDKDRIGPTTVAVMDAEASSGFPNYIGAMSGGGGGGKKGGPNSSMKNSTGGTTKLKPALFISGRVHPGETPASWMMKGMLDFLTSHTPQAQLLRQLFVIYIVPILNPDGVIVGNNRCCFSGVDLNRQWKTPIKGLHNTVFSLKNFMLQQRRIRDVHMYIDLHGHSRKYNIFMYGCDHEKKRPRPQVRAFPKFMSMHHIGQKYVCYEDCSFHVKKGREATARVVVAKELNIPLSFTLEATFCGSNYGPLKFCHMNIGHLQEVGAALCDAILQFSISEGLVKDIMLTSHELQKSGSVDNAAAAGGGGAGFIMSGDAGRNSRGTGHGALKGGSTTLQSASVPSALLTANELARAAALSAMEVNSDVSSSAGTSARTDAHSHYDATSSRKSGGAAGGAGAASSGRGTHKRSGSSGPGDDSDIDVDDVAGAVGAVMLGEDYQALMRAKSEAVAEAEEDAEREGDGGEYDGGDTAGDYGSDDEDDNETAAVVSSNKQRGAAAVTTSKDKPTGGNGYGKTSGGGSGSGGSSGFIYNGTMVMGSSSDRAVVGSGASARPPSGDAAENSFPPVLAVARRQTSLGITGSNSASGIADPHFSSSISISSLTSSHQQPGTGGSYQLQPVARRFLTNQVGNSSGPLSAPPRAEGGSGFSVSDDVRVASSKSERIPSGGRDRSSSPLPALQQERGSTKDLRKGLGRLVSNSDTVSVDSSSSYDTSGGGGGGGGMDRIRNIRAAALSEISEDNSSSGAAAAAGRKEVWDSINRSRPGQDDVGDDSSDQGDSVSNKKRGSISDDTRFHRRSSVGGLATINDDSDDIGIDGGDSLVADEPPTPSSVGVAAPPAGSKKKGKKHHGRKLSKHQSN